MNIANAEMDLNDRSGWRADWAEWNYYLLNKLPRELGGHWLWMGALDRDGYGKQTFNKQRSLAHRWVFMCSTGLVVPRELTLDHVCVRDVEDVDVSELHRQASELGIALADKMPEGTMRTFLRRCCNPEHMEVVTGAENTRRATNHNRDKLFCPSGHPYTKANTYRTSQGKRKCRACAREKARARRRDAAK
jgi:hypothetical protein